MPSHVKVPGIPVDDAVQLGSNGYVLTQVVEDLSSPDHHLPDPDFPITDDQDAGVRGLPARVGVEGRPVQDREPGARLHHLGVELPQVAVIRIEGRRSEVSLHGLYRHPIVLLSPVAHIWFHNLHGSDKHDYYRVRSVNRAFSRVAEKYFFRLLFQPGFLQLPHQDEDDKAYYQEVQ